MPFKKMLPEVVEALEFAEVTTISDFGKQVYSSMKAGANLLVTAPKGSGKTNAAIIATFNKVNKQLEGSPRVLYICNTIDEAFRVHGIMTKIAWRLDVTVDLAQDKADMVLQRNNIFNGTEIIVGNAKRIFDLYIQNGINFKLLDYLIIDDFEEILLSGRQMELKRMMEGMYKMQVIFLANSPHKRIEQFMESIDFPVKELNID